MQALLVTTLLPSRVRTVLLISSQSIFSNKTGEKIIPSIAGSADGAPGREYIAVMLAIIVSGLDCKVGELGLGCGGRRNAGLCVPSAASIQNVLCSV